MTDPNARLDIDCHAIEAHRGHVKGVVDGIAAAHGASHVPVGHDAFGRFGYFLADECRAAAADGTEMLAAAHAAADDLHQKLGVWAIDMAHTEGEITTLFSTAAQMRDA